MRLTVTACYDAATGVCYIDASTLPGLHAEAATFDELVAVIADVGPDLVAANLLRDRGAST